MESNGILSGERLKDLKIAALGNKIALLGLALAGVETRIEVDSPEEAVKRIADLSASGEYGIILVTSDIHRHIVDEIREMQERRPVPILVELPEIKEGEVAR